MILSIPHSSTFIPSEYRSMTTIGYLEDEIRIMTDWHTDALFSYDNAERTVHPVSRLITGPERFRDDSDELMALCGMGAVYARARCGDRLFCERHGHREEVLKRYYDSFHSALSLAVAREPGERGEALIVDCHSFSSIPLPHESGKAVPRPDFRIGADSFHTPDDLVRRSLAYFVGRGLKVKVNVPVAYYQKNSSVRPVMLEINRGLYMNEGNTEKLPSYNAVKDIVGGFLSLLYFPYGHS